MTARIIATILVNRAGAAVKGKRFASDRVVGVPVQMARVMAGVREIDELALLFVDATADGVCPDLGVVAAVAKETFIPLTVGGGIHSVEMAQQLIALGADKVVLGTAAFQNPPLITDIAARFGSQAVVVSVDARLSHNFNRSFTAASCRLGFRLRCLPVKW
jgi:cyclase